LCSDAGNWFPQGLAMKKIYTQQSSVYFFSSTFGPVAILWDFYKGFPKIFRILLSNSEA